MEMAWQRKIPHIPSRDASVQLRVHTKCILEYGVEYCGVNGTPFFPHPLRLHHTFPWRQATRDKPAGSDESPKYVTQTSNARLGSASTTRYGVVQKPYFLHLLPFMTVEASRRDDLRCAAFALFPTTISLGPTWQTTTKRMQSVKT